MKFETNKVYQGNCLELLPTFPDNFFHTCVTSPPYWGLRDYGMPDQLGQESTPEEFVQSMVKVFREVNRVLREDGTLWLNLGDTYTSGGRNTRDSDDKLLARGMNSRAATPEGLKPKDLIGIPWMVAFALRADGWYLRQDIIWNKPNPMPESVTDRCTKGHEYIFLLSKSPKYYYDHEAIKQPAAESTIGRGPVSFGGEKGRNYKPDENDPNFRNGSEQWGRVYEYKDGSVNKRSVWTVASKPYKEAHFATYPPELIIPCIKAGCPVGGNVLDPFFGSGTTGEVAERLGRNWVGCELNPNYKALADKRTGAVNPLFKQLAA